MDLSVIFATYKRTETLTRTLESLCRLETGGVSWELIVVDNADDPATRETVSLYSGALPLTYLVEREKGKNRALNGALEVAKGELFIFTDDDILAQPDWLTEMWRGAERWPECSVFGGRILPDFPGGTPPLSREHPFYSGAYGVADWELGEAPYNWLRVWGGNMAVRARVFKAGWRFNTAVGPAAGTNYVMGSETDLTRRLQEAGMPPVFLPNSLVYHQIRPEQMEARWLYGRALRYGRSRARQQGRCEGVHLFGAPRYLYRTLLEAAFKRVVHCRHREKRVDAGIEFWTTWGVIRQYREDTAAPLASFSASAQKR